MPNTSNDQMDILSGAGGDPSAPPGPPMPDQAMGPAESPGGPNSVTISPAENGFTAQLDGAKRPMVFSSIDELKGQLDNWYGKPEGDEEPEEEPEEDPAQPPIPQPEDAPQPGDEDPDLQA
jgi:hypothetical protein